MKHKNGIRPQAHYSFHIYLSRLIGYFIYLNVVNAILNMVMFTHVKKKLNFSIFNFSRKKTHAIICSFSFIYKFRKTILYKPIWPICNSLLYMIHENININ